MTFMCSVLVAGLLADISFVPAGARKEASLQEGADHCKRDQALQALQKGLQCDAVESLSVPFKHCTLP